MAVLVDSSAFYAHLASLDRNHSAARKALEELHGREELVTHSYIVVETTAIVQHRLGAGAVRELYENVLAPVETVWVDEQLHGAAVTALLAASARRISLVDRVSFELMRRRRIDRAFAFDRHFAAQGFETVP